MSPQKAARRASRAVLEAVHRRKEAHRMWLMLAGFAAVSVGLCVADYFWLRSMARQRHEQRYPHGEQTNTSVSALPPPTGKTNSTQNE